MKSSRISWDEISRKYVREPRDPECDFYKIVPRDPIENLRFRQELHERCRKDAKFAERIRIICKRDVLFWILAFGWLLEPRKKKGEKVIPFIPWDCQLKAITEAERLLTEVGDLDDESLDPADMLVDKSRTMGGSWFVIFVFYHRWAFYSECHFGVMSATKEKAENPNDPDALMSKFDFIWEHQPSYLRPERVRADSRMFNVWTGSTIMAYAGTGDAGRGGRKLAILMDEMGSWRAGDDVRGMASTQHITTSRFIVSTIPGPYGEYYRLRTACLDDSVKYKPAVLVVLDWKDVPNRRRGLYTSEDGKLIIIDQGYKFPPGYDFILDGLDRSPWLDKEWNRSNGNRRKILQEIYRDAAAAGSGCFDFQKFDAHIRDHASEPLRRLYLTLDEDPEHGWSFSYRDMEGGPLSLWCAIDDAGLAPFGFYSIGCDISGGAGSSIGNNSVAHVVNNTTGEQVAEYVSNRERPEKFADMVYALTIMFRTPFLNFESNGYGTLFKQRIMDELRYANVRMNRDVKIKKGKRTKTKRPGWHNGENGLKILFDPWENAVYGGQHTLRSARLLREAKCYVFRDGKVVWKNPDDDPDEAELGQAHGDRVVAAALAYMAMKERPAPAEPVNRIENLLHVKAPAGSPAAIIQDVLKKKAAAEYSWSKFN